MRFRLVGGAKPIEFAACSEGHTLGREDFHTKVEGTPFLRISRVQAVCFSCPADPTALVV